MKKIFALLLIIFATCSCSNNTILLKEGEFSMCGEIFNTSYSKEPPTLIIDVDNNSFCTTKIRFFGGETIISFIDGLKQMKDKYAEWEKVAKKNKVNYFTKPFDITFPECSLYWKINGSDYYGQNAPFNPVFVVNEYGQCSAKVENRAFDYYSETNPQQWSMEFNSKEEIQSLIDGIEYHLFSIVEKEISKKENDKLFQ